VLYLPGYTYREVNHIPNTILPLVQKYLEGTASAEEKAIVDQWYYSLHADEVVIPLDEPEKALTSRLKERMNAIISQHNPVRVLRKTLFFRIAAVFICITLVSTLCYFFFTSSDAAAIQQQFVAASVPVKDMAPGSNKAILTLGDGSTITLDSSSIGTLGQQGNMHVIKLADGRLQYKKDAHDPTAKQTIYNNIATPRGGQYAVELADGTKVWLNASSSIQFPTEFSDSVREVTITGEVYFEVAHQSKPFKVKVHDTSIRVLGTHFNVMAYDNESTQNTTLLQGSLVVGTGMHSNLLMPGNQLRIDKTGDVAVIKNADTEEAVAWRTGKFLFNSADMYSIMRQVERWYNVEVNFEGSVGLHFSGQLNRYANVSELLRKLELTNEVHFKLEKGKIIVQPGNREG
jgi:transmembrane sensor